MEAALGIGVMHGDARRVRGVSARMTAGLAALLLSLIALTPLSKGSSDTLVSVIVREVVPATDAAEEAIARFGGTVTRQLGIIGGFSARVRASAVEMLRKDESLLSLSADRAVRLQGQVDGFDPNSAGGWSQNLKAIKAPEMWKDGNTGRGVDVALIDSGVAPVEGLKGNVLNGPDLSFESQRDETRHLDAFGHGTHMASLIAGRDPYYDVSHDGDTVDVDDPAGHRAYKHMNKAYLGVAPDSRILNMKVATATGAVDVSQVIAAIDWVVQHRNTDGLNVRVINLSFGTDSAQAYGVDPLAYAVEVAWLRGIVVVAAAGNGGSSDKVLNNPAYDPYVIAVSATDTTSGDKSKYTTPSWQTRGDLTTRRPDVTAPGKSLVGLRVPGSAADQAYPSARVGDSRFFKGSGSSQATAMVSGAAALLLSQRPSLTPDQVKVILMGSATPLENADPVAQGSGLVNLKNAKSTPTPPATSIQNWTRSTGLGTLEGSRGTYRVTQDGVALTGEQDIFGKAWDGSSWTGSSWTGSSWTGGDWNGSTWTGSSWTGSSWTGSSWTGSSWTGSSWTGSSWTGSSWTGSSWTGSSWTGSSWTGSSWTGSSWTGSSWTGSSWTGTNWD